MRRSGHMRRRGTNHSADDGDERWLLTYSDMITLLMALFIVLFAISSVNISKYRTLQQALRAAFSGGNILPGGKPISSAHVPASPTRVGVGAGNPALAPLVSLTSPNALQSAAKIEVAATASSSPLAAHAVQSAAGEQEEFVLLKHQLEAYARSHGFGGDVHPVIEERGLAIRVLTDSLLFGSGSAALAAPGRPLLREIAGLLDVDQVHPVAVEGNTDDVPIHTAAFPSNWELSTSRASTVVRFLIGAGVHARRLSAAGYAELRPLASNATASGRARNRRVEIVLQRLH
ncbi:MAG TPA: flagellar motor protein MotB [Solirubrobacteraceae bacterium]|jgi:chemotaxis protein MotB|nr:flagellar motor protein MotB [Solirubrobacteraceae bacterium]